MDNWVGWLLFWALGVVTPFLIRSSFPRGRGREGEVYEDADSQLLNLELRSRWHNMGFWDEGVDEFPTACAQLARKVAGAAGLRKGERICDVGFGNGDSVLLWAKEYSPASIVGVTSLAGQCGFAAQAVTRSNLRASIDLKVGDAALLNLLPRSVDVCLAIDCAYHFHTRDAFFRSALKALGEGGRLGLTDLCLPATPLGLRDTLILRLICRVSGVPFSNLLSPAEYVERLQQLGFEDVELEDITSSVFPGFLRFLNARDKALGSVLSRKWAGLYAASRTACEWWMGGTGGRLRFVLVSARKQKSFVH